MIITDHRNRFVTDIVEVIEYIHWRIKDGTANYADVSMENEVLESEKGNEKGRNKEVKEVIITDIATEFE